MALAAVKNEDGWNMPPLTAPQGSEFGWFDRLFFGWRDGKIFDYSNWEAIDLRDMLVKDYKAAQIDKVQSLPIVSAERTMKPGKGDKGEFEFLQAFWEADPLNGGCATPLQQIVDRMTSAFSYKKAYNELWWDRGVGDFEGKTILRDVQWRPQTTCRLVRDAQSGRQLGFEQESYYTGPDITKNIWPIQVPNSRAFVYIHGSRRDPINGLSDMEIPFWAWKTKQKILFLWFQFLEGVSLPRTVVKANDPATAQDVANKIAKVKNSGVLPVSVEGNPANVDVQSLDLSGKGADQFMQAISWLDQCATNSVLASFLDLTGHATGVSNGPVGVHLSKDASDFFLQTLEAKAREMELSIRTDLFRPMIRANFGPSSVVPLFKFEPLNAEDKSDAVTMLTDLMRSRDPALVPDEFIGMLARDVANYMGMDGDDVYQAFEKAAAEAKAKAAAMSAAMASNTGQQVAGAAGAVGAAKNLVAQRGAPAAPKGPKQATISGINAPNLPGFY